MTWCKNNWGSKQRHYRADYAKTLPDIKDITRYSKTLPRGLCCSFPRLGTPPGPRLAASDLAQVPFLAHAQPGVLVGEMRQ